MLYFGFALNLLFYFGFALNLLFRNECSSTLPPCNHYAEAQVVGHQGTIPTGVQTYETPFFLVTLFSAICNDSFFFVNSS